MTCCICLDTPTHKYPTYLLACGCSQAWFHLHCEEQWLNSLNDEYVRCPTCRRDVPFQNVYSFAYESGQEQQTLRYMLISFSLECIVYLSNGLYSTPASTIGIVCIPVLIPTRHSIHHYIDIAQWKIYIDLIFYLAKDTDNINSFLYSSTLINVFCLTIFILQALSLYKKYVRRHILLPYLIQSDIIHTHIIYSAKKGAIVLKNPPSRNTYIFRVS